MRNFNAGSEHHRHRCTLERVNERWLELGVALELSARGSKLRGVIAKREVIVRRSFFGAVALLELEVPSRPAFMLRRKGQLFMANTDPFLLDDPRFDACFSIEGVRDHAFAALSAPAREEFCAHLTSLVAGEVKASFEYLPDVAQAATDIRRFVDAIDAIDFSARPLSLALLEGMKVERVPEVTASIQSLPPLDRGAPASTGSDRFRDRST